MDRKALIEALHLAESGLSSVLAAVPDALHLRVEDGLCRLTLPKGTEFCAFPATRGNIDFLQFYLDHSSRHWPPDLRVEPDALNLGCTHVGRVRLALSPQAVLVHDELSCDWGPVVGLSPTNSLRHLTLGEEDLRILRHLLP